jgi:hypothetical protein
VVTTADGRTASVDVLVRRVDVPGTNTIEERVSQVGEPLIPCVENTRTLVRKGNHLTVTLQEKGLSGEGVQEESSRWSWELTTPSGLRLVSVAELIPSGHLRVVNRQLNASGREASHASGTYAPVTQEEYDRRHEAFLERCTHEPRP